MATLASLIGQLTKAISADPTATETVKAELAKAGLVPASRRGQRTVTMPKDAKAQGAAMLSAYLKAVGAGKLPPLSQNEVRYPMQVAAFAGIPATTAGTPDWQAAYVMGQCVRLALGYGLGGAMDFSAKESSASGHYCFIGKLWKLGYSLQRDKDGKFRPLIGKPASAPTKASGKVAKPSTQQRSEAGGNLAKLIVHTCGAKAIAGSTCSNCGQKVARATSTRTRKRQEVAADKLTDAQLNAQHEPADTISAGDNNRPNA